MIAIVSDWTRDQITQWTIIVAGLSALGLFVRWIYKVGKVVIEAAEFIKHELQENSGRSQKDYAIRNDRRVEFLFQHQGIEMPDDMKSPPEQH